MSEAVNMSKLSLLTITMQIGYITKRIFSRSTPTQRPFSKFSEASGKCGNSSQATVKFISRLIVIRPVSLIMPIFSRVFSLRHFPRQEALHQALGYEESLLSSR